MSEFAQDKFKEYWKKTEVIREYQRMLYTFGDMDLPYVFAAEHSRFKDRTLVRRGIILFQKPQILLPHYYGGPEFKEGFEHAGAIPAEATYLFRAMKLPFSHITNRLVAEELVEYGGLQDVLNRFEEKMKSQEDSETGLIKGILEGADISLMRYSMGLVIKSAPGNVREFFEHIRRQRGEPINPDDRITDEDIKRLFE
ncbi:MAG: hypothetical protein A2167_08290 [Planctomycetes bacterium RBG_13_46_10]|nr:MAG: hypothetical protein A2167_08290 [Planctomycetes bacterium RBG_13_46_10]